MHTWLPEFRQTLRSLRRSPGLPVVVIATLALGIGTNSAIFSVVDGVLLKPLPWPTADRLVRLVETVQRDELEERSFSWPDFADLVREAETLDRAAVYSPAEVTITFDGQAERVGAEVVSDHYFGALGSAPIAGRSFDHGAEDAADHVMLGYGLWQRAFGGSDDAIGRTLEVNGRAREVIGIMPPGFSGLSDAESLWLPVAVYGDALSRDDRFLEAVAQLVPGASIDRARAEISAVFERLAVAYPDDNHGYGATAIPLKEALVGDLRRPLAILLTAVGLVLLIACTNLANLLLARAARRHRDTVIRAALGASRLALVRSAMAEVILLGLAGGALGLLFSLWALDLLTRLMPVELPGFVTIGVDGRSAVFALVLALATGIVLGGGVALGAGRLRLQAALRGSERGSVSVHQRRFRAALIVTQVALALALLIGAGLMLRSFHGLLSVDTGFEPSKLAMVRYDLPTAREDEAKAVAYAGRLREVLEALPGVERVAFGSSTPYDDVPRATVVSTELARYDPSAVYGGGVRVYRHSVSEGYFRTIGIPIERGRSFTEADRTPELRSVIVSRRLGERLWPDEDPIGKRLRFGAPARSDAVDPDEDPRWLTVVGVVADVRFRRLVDRPGDPTDPDAYFPMRPRDHRRATVVARTTLPPDTMIGAITKTARRLDPEAPIFGQITMGARLQARTARARFSAILMGFFSATALALAGIGIYGVMSYTVGNRTREIGIRMALGAPRDRVASRVARDGLTLVLVGVGLGLAGSWALTRVLTGTLEGLATERDPASFLAATVLLLGVATLGCYLPARRASRVDPIVALRDD